MTKNKGQFGYQSNNNRGYQPPKPNNGYQPTTAQQPVPPKGPTPSPKSK